MLAITERFGFVTQHFNSSVHLVYWFTSRFTEDVKLCCNWKYIKENKQSDFVSNCLIFSVLLVIRECFVLLTYIFDYQAVTTPVYVSMYHSVYHIWYVDEDKITPDFGPVKAVSLILTIISRIPSN